MKILVIPDVHLKPWMFDRASEIMSTGAAEKAVCLMDIPDDWRRGFDTKIYTQTFERAIWFQRSHPDTLWCYGNHDLSYAWLQDESGFSVSAIYVVNEGLRKLRKVLPDDDQLAYIHRIDDVLFLHGGLTHAFVKYYAPDVDYEDTDAIIKRINALGREEMWDDASPIWYRPQFYYEEMYREKDILQVVGHTPVREIGRMGNVVSCDLFSTYKRGDPIGTQEFLLIDTETWEYEGVQ